MKKIFKLLVFCIIFYAGLFFGEAICNIKQQRKELKKDTTGQYHNVCKSQLAGKLQGKPCSLCIKKWQYDHPDTQSEADKIIRYCEKIKGKELAKFTSDELNECLLMMLE